MKLSKINTTNMAKIVFIFPYILLITGIILILSGIFKGEPDAIYRKAAMICMECIGIG